jgi:hypothetical protein
VDGGCGAIRMSYDAGAQRPAYEGTTNTAAAAREWPGVAMIQPRNCPKCDGRLSEGFVIDRGYGVVSVSTWQAGEPVKRFLTGIRESKAGQHEIATWRCERCGFLESYAP